jgi:hypothetical protein
LHWFFHKVPLDEATQSNPLVTDKIRNLGETSRVDIEDMEDRLAYVAMFREVSKVFGTRNLTEEYVACRFWPLKAGWLVYQGLAAGGALDQRDSCAELCCLLQSEETS